MGGAIAAAFVATFPDLVEDEVVLLASAGLLEAADLSRTAKFMSSPLVQALTANHFVYAYLRRLAAGAPPPADATHELVRLQSAHLPGFNRAVSSSLRAGPVTGLRWRLRAPRGRGKGVDFAHHHYPHPDSATHPQTARTQVELALIPGAGQGLTWTHAGRWGRRCVRFFGEA
ncbi:hypothetical protein B0H17DRAFT_1078002 [Mycena rosella]|uniref:Uncharacterized protein n=1 Tax=Mycena rosella TaxID=1033263 RepID=A0AAD7D6A2_MYCRO|nr:hypothetical protein B0H17DRAFT_1078002 [Mycena rosella]